MFVAEAFFFVRFLPIVFIDSMSVYISLRADKINRFSFKFLKFWVETIAKTHFIFNIKSSNLPFLSSFLCYNVYFSLFGLIASIVLATTRLFAQIHNKLFLLFFVVVLIFVAVAPFFLLHSTQNVVCSK